MMMIACGGDSKKGSTDSSSDADTQIKEITFPDNGETAPAGTTTTTQVTPPPAEPPQNATGVWHYTCPNGCEGGGGAAGPCAKCGATLAHNSAYHGSGGTTTTTTTPPPAGTNPGATTISPPVEPAQNAAGVWHFTCPNGCDGGGGAVGPCTKCGGTLAHNQAYHQ